MLLSECGGESWNYFIVRLEDGVLSWWMARITLSLSNGGTAKGVKRNGKSIKQRAVGRSVADMQEVFSPPSLVQPFDRNFVPHWKTRAVCFHANNSSESKKSDGSGERGWFVIFFVCMLCYIRRKFRPIMW